MPTTTKNERAKRMGLSELGRAAIAQKRADRRRSGRPQSIKPRAEAPPKRRKPLPQTERRPIESNVDYPVEVFLRYTGMTDSGLRKEQRKGLIVRFTGSRRMVLGLHWIEHRERQAKEEERAMRAAADGTATTGEGGAS